MPADYEKIREENIARYGWDTAVLDLLGQLYSERTHFIFELIQNAEDAGATELAFSLLRDRLEVRHDGRPFTEADVRGVCGVGQSGKSASDQLTAIGKFGIGFKSVYAYTKSPRVYSGDEAFGIESYVRPFAVPPVALPSSSSQTLFVFPFDLDAVPAATAFAEISAALDGLQPGVLLFLTSIGRLSAGEGAVLTRSVAGGAPRRVRLARGRRAEEWLVWSRRVEGVGRPVEIAFRVSDDRRLIGCDRSPLTVVFPTEKETFLGFLIEGPYRTTPARDNVPEHDPANQALARETAALLADVVRSLRDDGLLSAPVLAALPLDAARFPAGSLLHPLWASVREALAGEALIPVAGGGYAAAASLRLAQDAELRGLLGPDQLAALYGISAALADPSAAAYPVLWQYLVDVLGIGEVTAAGVVANLTVDFLRAQTDEWIARLYAFLFGHSVLWRSARFEDEEPGPARTAPIIRLEDGSQVAPFDAEGRPAVYLPGAASVSGLATVRRAVADSPAARQFLEALGLARPDVLAEVLSRILPRYEGLGLSELDPAQHAADLEAVMLALEEAGAGPRAELLDRLAQTPFLIGENAATGEQRLTPPTGLYQRSRELESYFDGNPDAWFAADRYGPWLAQLRGMGVRQDVAVRARTPDALGYVVTVVEFGRNERGLDGFDPDASIDGLEFALRHPSPERSEYVWNVLLVPHRNLVAGAVERSVMPSFSDSSRERRESSIGLLAAGEAWLPGRDGVFHLPGELSLDDLPSTYTPDEGLAQALHMLQPVVGEAARRLGIPVEVLWGLSARPDLVALVSRELAACSVDPT
ncbi:MAG: sacsin N-terminal ATP-binding-like domain-containing protein [Streptosporangiaceae bacterium]